MWVHVRRKQADGYTRMTVFDSGSELPAENEGEVTTYEYMPSYRRTQGHHDTGPLSGAEICAKSLRENRVLHTALSSLLYSSLTTNAVYPLIW